MLEPDLQDTLRQGAKTNKVDFIETVAEDIIMLIGTPLGVYNVEVTIHAMAKTYRHEYGNLLPFTNETFSAFRERITQEICQEHGVVVILSSDDTNGCICVVGNPYGIRRAFHAFLTLLNSLY